MDATGDDPTTPRLSSEHTVLVVVRPDAGVSAEGFAERLPAVLEGLYHGLEDVTVAVRHAGPSVLAVVSVGTSPPAGLDATRLLVWGLPVTPTGEATTADLRMAVRNAETTRDWLGSYVIADITRDSVRLLTSLDLRPTLRVVEGPSATAFATRSLAASIAGGLRPRIDQDRIPELVQLGAVLVDDELVDGVRRVEEGAVVDIDRSGITVRCLAGRGERLHRSPHPTTPEQLRASLGDVLQAYGHVPNTHLAMTGGRDSLLLASCADERDVRLPTFTFGPSPDSTAAAAVADDLGWPHTEVVFADGDPRWDEVVRLSAWTEGAATAWDLAGPGPLWPHTPGATWLSGLGGESGRAFYWDAPPAPGAAADLLVSRVTDGLPTEPRQLLAARLRSTLADLRDTTGRDGADLLDVFYALGRVRGWMLRGRPMPMLRAAAAGYTSPSVTSALLDLPDEQRADGSGFDRALALGAPLRHVAAAAAAPPQRTALQRLVALASRIRRGSRDPGGTLLTRFAKQVAADSIARRAMGDRWWAWMSEHAPYDATARTQGWQALAVDALHHRLASVPALPRAG